ncbi:MAG: helix-turn-helix transcriptional regulator [Clostridia bacterium]|nr:helix-turn-helix transcriptional regulator [Clostridia bacterium]
MLDQKIFGEKLRNHRKSLGLTQEDVAERMGVSPQAVSKWEAGDCLPDCYNLKAVSEVYNVSVDVLLDTQADSLETVVSKIEQLATEYVWAHADECEGKSLRKQLGDELWQMWKAIYFVEVGDKKLQKESKMQGNLRIGGDFGLKLWDDAGLACVVKSTLVKNMLPPDCHVMEVLSALAARDGQSLIFTLGDNGRVHTKDELIEKTKLPLPRLNELLLLFSENQVIEFVSNSQISHKVGYRLSSHCGIAAHMILAAAYILGKKEYTVSEYLHFQSED